MFFLCLVSFALVCSAWCAEQEYIASREFYGRALSKLSVKDEHFMPIYSARVAGRMHFGKSTLATARVFAKIDKKEINCETYICKAVCDRDARDRFFSEPIPVHLVCMVSLSFEVSNCQSLFNSIAQKFSDTRSLCYCTGFKSARSMRLVAEDNGVELFVGKTIFNPGYCGPALGNDYSHCFRDLPSQGASRWVFLGSSDTALSEAGEFFFQWVNAAIIRNNVDAHVSFFFSFIRLRPHETLQYLIIQAFLKAQRVSAYKKFDENYKMSKQYEEDLKEACLLFKNRVHFYSVRSAIEKGFEVLLSDNASNALFNYKPLKANLNPLDRCSRVDMLVGVPPAMKKDQRADYLTSCYAVLELMSQRYKGQRKLGCINGCEESDLFEKQVERERRGNNRDCVLVYAAWRLDVACVETWALSIYDKFSYGSFLPIPCSEKRCDGQYLLLSLEV